MRSNHCKWTARLAVAGLAIAAGCLMGLGRNDERAAAQPAAHASNKQSAVTAQRAKAVAGPLKKAYRFEKGGWIYVHLQGSPADVGYQHGYLLAAEIEDAFHTVRLMDTRGSGKDWEFFRYAAGDMLWPKINREYREELEGIVEGLRAHGVRDMDLDDVVALNAFEELPDYYVPWYDAHHQVAEARRILPEGHCSAFVATGSWTRSHGIVIAHNNWTSYLDGERWRIIFDIVPAHGHRILMDGFPGVITSDDDFGINSAGIMITETTLTQFKGWNPGGIPEFVRSRRALQYSNSIDDYVRIMVEGNNGGYANDWLLGDRKTGEIAQFELGLKHHRVWRTKNGYFAGSNWARDPQVIRDETTFNPHDMSSSPNARRVRWDELMKQYKGRIDVALAEQFLGDHYDTYLKKEQADSRTLCGHADLAPKGVPEWDWGPFYPGGAVQGKATDSAMAKAMTIVARMGHPGGQDFLAAPFLKAHPEYDWQSPMLRDMKAGPWTDFSVGQKR
jgi:Phospholipase B